MKSLLVLYQDARKLELRLEKHYECQKKKKDRSFSCLDVIMLEANEPKWSPKLDGQWACQSCATMWFGRHLRGVLQKQLDEAMREGALDGEEKKAFRKIKDKVKTA